jgi:WD40 repeat protein
MINFLKKYKVLLIIVCSFIILFFVLNDLLTKKGVDVVSVSSDGHYAITTDESERAVLWNLQKHTSQLLDKKVHVFSAYFIPQTQDYLWQDQNKIIHIRNIENKNQEDFKIPYFVFGQAMTKDRKYYMLSSIGGGLFLRDKGRWEQIASANPNKGEREEDLTEGSELLMEKPYNLSISPDQNYILGIDSAASLFLYNLKGWTNFPYHLRLYDRTNPQGKAFATLSPDGKYVVGGDESSRSAVWNTQTGEKIFKNYDIVFGKDYEPRQDSDLRGLTVKRPDDFVSASGLIRRDATLSIKFIDKTHYLRFSTYIPYAILYEVTNPAPLKYFPLGRSPWPAVNYYARNQAIDTSWQSHTLVMGKETEEGILVYQYDPEKQTLTKVWDGHSCTLPRLGCLV